MVANEPRLPVEHRTHRRKPEDTAEGCREHAAADRTRAADMTNEHMRGSLERSAETWGKRASLLDRLEISFNARAEACAREQNAAHSGRNDDGEGTGPIEQGKAQAEGERRQAEKKPRPRIKGLSTVETPDRKETDAD